MCPLCQDKHQVGVPFVTQHHKLSLRSPISVDRGGAALSLLRGAAVESHCVPT